MRPTPTSKDPAVIARHWDEEYDAGSLDFLRGLKQQARSGMIAAWLKQTDALAHVLDVGCGEGLVWDFLKPYGMARYTGVDVSAKALALAKVGPEDRLVTAALEEFKAEGETYSAIIFNEVLYFAADPAGEVRRYLDYLSPGGVIVVSMYAPDRADSGAHKHIDAVWAETDGPGYRVIDDVTIRGGVKTTTFKMRLVGRAD